MKRNVKKSVLHFSVVDRQGFDANKDPTYSIETLKQGQDINWQILIVLKDCSKTFSSILKLSD